MALLSFGFELEKSEIENLIKENGYHGKINFEQFTKIIKNKFVILLLFFL
jgi:Ca2+-binding EF-hand superfamily protein